MFRALLLIPLLASLACGHRLTVTGYRPQKIGIDPATNLEVWEPVKVLELDQVRVGTTGQLVATLAGEAKTPTQRPKGGKYEADAAKACGFRWTATADDRFKAPQVPGFSPPPDGQPASEGKNRHEIDEAGCVSAPVAGPLAISLTAYDGDTGPGQVSAWRAFWAGIVSTVAAYFGITTFGEVEKAKIPSKEVQDTAARGLERIGTGSSDPAVQNRALDELGNAIP